jgi:hypothetical protein
MYGTTFVCAGTGRPALGQSQLETKAWVWLCDLEVQLGRAAVHATGIQFRKVVWGVGLGQALKVNVGGRVGTSLSRFEIFVSAFILSTTFNTSGKAVTRRGHSQQ